MYFVVYRDAAKQWRVDALAANNKKIADSGEGYINKADCLAAIDPGEGRRQGARAGEAVAGSLRRLQWLPSPTSAPRRQRTRGRVYGGTFRFAKPCANGVRKVSARRAPSGHQLIQIAPFRSGLISPAVFLPRAVNRRVAGPNPT